MNFICSICIFVMSNKNEIIKMTTVHDDGLECVIERITGKITDIGTTASNWYNFVIAEKNISTNSNNINFDNNISKEQKKEFEQMITGVNNFLKVIKTSDVDNNVTIFVAYLKQREKYTTFDENSNGFKFSHKKNNVNIPLIVTVIFCYNDLPFTTHMGTFKTSYGIFRKIKKLSIKIHKYASVCYFDKLEGFFGRTNIKYMVTVFSPITTILFLKTLHYNQKIIEFGDFFIGTGDNYKGFNYVMEHTKINKDGIFNILKLMDNNSSVLLNTSKSAYDLLPKYSSGIKQNISTPIYYNKNNCESNILLDGTQYVFSNKYPLIHILLKQKRVQYFIIKIDLLIKLQ